MRKIIDIYCGIFEFLIALMLALMVILVFGNVVLRYGFNSGIAISEEVARWLFIWITFLGAVVALRERAHLGVDMLVSRLPVAGKKLCLAASYACMLYILWLLYEGSLAQVRINWDTEAPVTGASVGIFYASGVMLGISSMAILLRDLLRTLLTHPSDQELVMVQESEEVAALEQPTWAMWRPIFRTAPSWPKTIRPLRASLDGPRPPPLFS